MHVPFLAIHVSTILITSNNCFSHNMQYQSCFISALHEPCEPGKCVLQTLPGSRSSIYKCCCRGMHVCNTKFIYPDLNATSTTPLLPMTTVDTTGTDGEVSTTPGLCVSLCVRMYWVCMYACVHVCLCVCMQVCLQYVLYIIFI